MATAIVAGGGFIRQALFHRLQLGAEPLHLPGCAPTSMGSACTRPVLANERVQTNAAGPVVLKLKTAWRDGTTHLVMSPLEFMQRLAALVLPQKPEPPAQAAASAGCEATCAHHRPVRLSWAKLLKRVFEIDVAHCPNCGGRLEIIAAILEQPVIERILTHLGLQARAPPRSPAHGSQIQAA